MIPGLGKGYDYDVINSDVILNRMTVENGRVVLPDGMSYRMMLLPLQDHMSLEVLEKIKEMVDRGTIIIGHRPKTVPGRNNFEAQNIKLKNITDQLWGKVDGTSVFENSYGKGRVIDGLTAEQVLLNDGIKNDFDFSGSSEIDYIHRATVSEDMYFLRNEKEETVRSTCYFRVSGKYPELWDPSTGRVQKADEFTEEEGLISFDIELPTHGSIFVVFSNKKRASIQSVNHDKMQAKHISGPWEVRFPDGWGAPESAIIKYLTSWTEVEDEGIKYFSGATSYFNSFSMSEDEANNKILHDLEEDKDVTEIFINGESAGALWKEPYSLDITNLVKTGDNELKIEVVNMWVNRLIGDMHLPPEKHFCSTNQNYMTSENWPGGDETFRVQKAGL